MSAEPHWWVWKIHRDKPIVRGYYDSEQEAYQNGLRDLGNDFEVLMLYTTDMTKAKAKVSEIILKRTQDLDTALRRQSHQPLTQEENPKIGTGE
jgi:hypothetical protein